MKLLILIFIRFNPPLNGNGKIIMYSQQKLLQDFIKFPSNDSGHKSGITLGGKDDGKS
jgi:hypothetical protein